MLPLVVELIIHVQRVLVSSVCQHLHFILSSLFYFLTAVILFLGGVFGMLMRKGLIGAYGLSTLLDQKFWQSAVSTQDMNLVDGSSFNSLSRY
jgi:hypothetical protein